MIFTVALLLNKRQFILCRFGPDTYFVPTLLRIADKKWLL